MKILITGVALFGALSVSADLTSVSVKDFTGSYEKPVGRATASELVIPSPQKSKIEITLEGVEEGYLLKYGEEEFLFKNPPSMIEDIYTGNWKDINFVTKNNSVNASIKNFSSIIEYSETNLRDFTASCRENRTFENYGYQLMDACLSNASYTLGFFETESTRKILNIFEGLPGVRASKIGVKEGKISVNSNSFKINAKVDIGMSAKVKIEGKSKFEEDKKRVSIRIDKAKASFLNIKKQIFNELRKSQSDTLKVEEPYIYLLVK